jgi:hypothetical protein
MSDEDIFLKISQELTGLTNLDRDLANDYYHILEMKFNIYIDELLGIYKQVEGQPDSLNQLISRIENNVLVLHVAKQIARIWYVSQFRDTDPASKVQLYGGHWKEGLLWKVIRAHPPAYTNHPDELGYWKFHPDTLKD